MTSPESLDVREVIFINERCRLDYEGLPADVRESADEALDALQNAQSMSAKLWRPLRGSLSGAYEIRLPYDGDTYRVYVTMKLPWAIMVLDAGIKKSTEGTNIPRWQRERLEARYKSARVFWKEHEAELELSYDKRRTRRDKLEKEIGR